MRGFHIGRSGEQKGHELNETIDLLRRYVIQETIQPIKHIARALVFQVAGAVAVGIGTLFFMVAGLRALQTETGSTFAGRWSFAPYLLMAGAAALSIGLLAFAALRRPRKAA